MKEREALLKDLETFLTSLSTAKRSIQAVAAVRGLDRATILQKQQKLELLEQKVHSLRQTAIKLDEYLEMAEISLEDPEYGGQTSCKNLVDVFFIKVGTVKQTMVEKLRAMDNREDSAMTTLNGTLSRHLLAGDGQVTAMTPHPHEEEIQRFPASKIHSVLQEIKVRVHCTRLDIFVSTHSSYMNLTLSP